MAESHHLFDGTSDNPVLISPERTNMWKRSSSFTSLLFFFFLLATSSASSDGHGDGIVITLGDYQGLQVFRHTLEDPYGVLHSWNDTGLAACSSGWVGIKCVMGRSSPSSSAYSLPCPSVPFPNLPPSSVSPRNGHRLSTRDIIHISCGAVILLLLLLCCVLLCYLLRKRSTLSQKSKFRGKKPGSCVEVEAEAGREDGGKLVHFDGPFVFTTDDLLCATAEKMGKSTYGIVHKATGVAAAGGDQAGVSDCDGGIRWSN